MCLGCIRFMYKIICLVQGTGRASVSGKQLNQGAILVGAVPLLPGKKISFEDKTSFC